MYKASGKIERYIARLVAKEFNQREGFDYDETFSLVVKKVIVRCLINIDVVNNWPLYYLDLNNAFLYGDLIEYIYMALPQGYDNVDKSKVCKLNKSLYGLKQALNLDILKYFLEIEILENEKGICMSQRKYCLELLLEYRLLAAKLVDIPFPENIVPDISDVVHCMSQHMHSPLQSYYKAALRVLRYLKGSPGCGVKFNKKFNLKHKAYTDVDWAKCPKTRKSAEYRSMASTTCDVVWLRNLLHGLGLKDLYPLRSNAQTDSTYEDIPIEE
ncbi:ribonuclease H-like domain-containing protein [Tanacetum coccineum]